MGHLAEAQDEWDIIDLRNLREEGEERTRIEQALARTNLFYRILPEPEECPYLPIEADSSDRMARLSGDVRRTLQQRMKKAAAEDLRTRIIENPHQEPGLLKVLIELEWKKHIKSQHRRLSAVIRKSFNGYLNVGPTWLALCCSSRTARSAGAFQMGFRCGKKLWDYSKAYDPLFSRFAPGTLLLPALLEYGLSQGLEEYDFLQREGAVQDDLEHRMPSPVSIADLESARNLAGAEVCLLRCQDNHPTALW